jgi:hypothetical protein
MVHWNYLVVLCSTVPGCATLLHAYEEFTEGHG